MNKAPAKPRTPAQPDAPDAPVVSGAALVTVSAPAGQRPVAVRPAALRAAAAAQLAESVGLCIAGIFGAISTADGKSSSVATGIALTVLAFGTAVGLGAVAIGLAQAKPWSRTPAVMTQLFVVIAGIMLLDGHRPEWGVPALVLAAACTAGLLTPASLRALNRPSIQQADRADSDRASVKSR